MTQKSENIVRYTADELREMRARGEDQTDYARLDAMTEEELEAAIASDPDEAGWEVDWSTAMAGIPGPKEQITLRIDGDIVNWFKDTGKGYQTRINTVLRRYVEAQKRA
ncbi:BrnA antitoxin family protein [soil metagenome]